MQPHELVQLPRVPHAVGCGQRLEGPLVGHCHSLPLGAEHFRNRTERRAPRRCCCRFICFGRKSRRIQARNSARNENSIVGRRLPFQFLLQLLFFLLRRRLLLLFPLLLLWRKLVLQKLFSERVAAVLGEEEEC